MVGRKKRRSKGAELLGSHQKCWIWGRHAVLETLRAGRWPPLEVTVDPTWLDDAVQSELTKLVALQQITLTEMSGPDLSRLCGATEHQGLLAKMPPYPYASMEMVLKKLHGGSAVLVLAGVQDPFNFGSILRSADVFGFDAVFVPSKGQASVSAHVTRSSVGAVNYLDIVQMEEPLDCCRRLKTLGLQLVAATEKGEHAPAHVNLQSGTALLIGNEGTGIPVELLEISDLQVCIPLQGHINSLNAAVAAGILCYELRRQRESL